MRIYFPPSLEEASQSSYLFHQDLSEEEQEQLQEAADLCLQLLERYVADEEAG